MRRDKSGLKDDSPAKVSLDLSVGLAGLEDVEANHIIHLGRHLLRFPRCTGEGDPAEGETTHKKHILP